MVVFCTKQREGKISFRSPVAADLLNSFARQKWIPPGDNLEIRYSDVVGDSDRASDAMVLRRGQEERLEKYHPMSAAGHWRIMRTVLPDAVWEQW
jgi:hypothetical protein